MIDQNWVFLAVAINLVGAIIYSYSVVKGNTRPNRVTWFILSFAPLLAFAAMMLQGVSFRESVFTLETGISPLIIFISTFFAKQPKWEITRFDLTCGALSIFGFLLWIILKEGNIAITFAIAADGLAFLPTLVKAFRYPETESPWAFMMGTVAALIALAIITTWDYKHVAFPMYILVADILATLFIFFKIGKYIHVNKSKETLLR
ncbi:MAG TPA: hypothetical protein PK096_03365 [Candidatus Saccharibacteria bacterium]|nr:hypothetical protein [Candidatus Saccharibacteria bacterium]HRK94382.1 hypothetical protein [Candidatus Saccharibacteria bacterium]